MVDDPKELLDLLHELARLELDLLVRDLDGEAAVRLLLALQQELEAILERAQTARETFQHQIAALEERLRECWGTGDAATPLGDLARARKGLAELDATLGPAQTLAGELARRTVGSEPPPCAPSEPPEPPP